MQEPIVWNHAILEHLKDFPTLEGNYDYLDFTNKRVLDCGSSDGMHSFNAEKKGASEVWSIDIFDGQYGQHTLGATQDKDWKYWGRGYLDVHKRLNSKCKYIFPYSVYDISKEKFGEFDVVLMLGLLYHLVHPALALEKANEVLKEGGLLVIDCEISPLGTFFAGNNTVYNNDKTNFSILSISDLKEILKFSGFQEENTFHRARNRVGMVLKKVGVPNPKYSYHSVYSTMGKISNVEGF